MPKKQDKDIGEALEQAWRWFSRPTWTKVSTGVVAILVALWGYLNLGDGIEKTERRLDRQGKRLNAVERALDARFDRLDERADDLEASERELNRTIQRAVERGIKRGVRQALQQM